MCAEIARLCIKVLCHLDRYYLHNRYNFRKKGLACGSPQFQEAYCRDAENAFNLRWNSIVESIRVVSSTGSSIC